jgi:hypothetical protein
VAPSFAHGVGNWVKSGLTTGTNSHVSRAPQDICFLSRRIPFVPKSGYFESMSFRCILGRHRPMLTSIVRRTSGFEALCDECGLPIERSEGSRWISSEPLVLRHGKTA